MDLQERVTRSATMVEPGIVVSDMDLSSNRSAHKLDPSCMVCGNDAWTVFNPKKYCKFCYRCVCKPCSGQTLMHPERKKQERCCSNCYRRFLSQNVINDAVSMQTANNAELKEVEAEFKAAREGRNIKSSTVKNLRESLEKVTQEMMFTQKDIDLKCDHLSKSIGQLRAEAKSIEAELAKHAVSFSAAESQLKASESSLATEKSAQSFYAEKHAKAKAELITSQDEFDRLRRMLDERQIGIPAEGPDNRAPNSAKIAELQSAINQLRQQQAALTLQNETIKRELSNREEEEDGKAQSTEGEESEEKLFPLYCELREQNDHLKREKEQLSATEYREREIAKLSRDLNKLQTDNEEMRTYLAKQQSSPRSKRPRLVGR